MWVRRFCEADNVGSERKYGVRALKNRDAAERTRFTPVHGVDANRRFAKAKN